MKGSPNITMKSVWRVGQYDAVGICRKPLLESMFCSKKCEKDAPVWDLKMAMTMIKELNSLGRKQSENDISDAMAQAMFWIREKQNQQ